MIKPKLRKVLPVLLSVSMVFSMINPLMAVSLQAAEPAEQTGNPSDNVDLGESADTAISEGASETDISVEPSDTGNGQNVQEGQPDSKSSPAVPEEQGNGPTQPVTDEPAVQSEGERTEEPQAETRLTVNINDAEYTVSIGQEFSEVVSGQFTSLADITSVEFVSGTVTQDDLGYFKTNKSKLTGLQILKVNLDEDLAFEGGTVLPEGILNVTSGLKSLQKVEIAGFTEIGASALKINALTDISMPDVKVIGASAFSGCSKLTSVDLTNVESVGDRAFEKTGITSVRVLPGKTYGSYVFSSCSKLASADLTGITKVPASMFNGCSALSSVIMPDVKTVGMNAFYNCSKLSLDADTIAQFDRIGSGAFYSCKAITGALNLSGKVLEGTSAFRGTGITEVDLTGQDTIPNMYFYGCTKLKKVVLSGTSSIGNSTFYGCTVLDTVDLTGVKDIGEKAFYNCKALTNIDLPDTISIGDSAFSGCTSVTEVHMSKVEAIGASAFAGIKNEVQVTAEMATPPEVDGTPFANAAAGSTISVPAGTLEKYAANVELGSLEQTTTSGCWGGGKLQVVDSEYVNLTYTDTMKTPVTRYQVIKKGQSIGEEPFAITRNGYKLNGIYTDESLSEPEGGVTSSYVPEESGTLYFDWTTIKVQIADKDGEIIETIDLPTDTYNELNTLYPELPEGALQWNTEADGSGQVILADTKIYSDITLYPIYDTIINVTVKINDGEDIGAANLGLAFQKADADTVTKVEILSGKLSSSDYKWMNNGFMKTVETLIIADGVESENKTIPAGTATSAPKLKYLEIHGVEKLEDAAIMSTNLETVILPDVKEIGANALGTFGTSSTTTKMKTVEMPNIERLGNSVFSHQDQLTELNFPKLTYIGNSCFNECGAIRITVDQLPETGTNPFGSGTSLAKGSILVVPADVYDAYMAENDSDSFQGINLERGAELTSVVKAVIDGQEIGGNSLQDAVEKSGIDADDVKSIEFISGTITQDDLKYLKNETTYLQTLKMNLSESLQLADSDGAETTVIPGSAFQNTRLETVEIAGFTEIRGMAFQGCTSLKAVSMPDVVTIGKNAFYWTDDYEEIVLPETIEALNTCGFGIAKNGTKTIHVTMEGAVPPETTGTVFSKAGSNSYVTVPEGSLENYLPDLDLTKYFGTGGETKWASMRVADSAYNLITYRGENSWDVKYAYVKAGESVTEARIPMFEKDGFELSGWNTAKDGTGTLLTAETIPTESMTVYAQWEEPQADVITVKINGTDVSGSDLEDAVAKSGTEIKNLTEMEVVSGIVTQTDLDYISQITYLESFTMNLGEGLTMYDKDGNVSTVLGENENVLKFADAPKGWSKPAIRTVVLGGITEIQKGGLTARSAETVSMPDVVTVGVSAFSGMSWLEELNIENAVTVGKSAFFNCTRLTDLTMNKVKTLGEGSFKNTNSLKRMTLPESIKTIENIEFGVTSQGNKNGTKITIKAMTPPEVASGAFKGVASSGGTYSTITVPHGALAAYVQQIDPKADATKVLKIKDIIWNNLYLREEGSYLVEYSTGNSWETQFAYVAAGEALTTDQIADYEVEGQLLAGWNTAKDGTGDMLAAGTVLAGDVKVYPVLKDAVTLTVHVGDEATEIPVVKGEAIGDRLPADPAMEGHIFKGWNTAADGSGTAVTADTVAEDDMEIYAVFEEEPVILPDIDSVTAENGKVTIILKDKPTETPVVRDITIQLNINGSGNKDIEIRDFTYDGDKTIVLTFDEIVKTEKQQTFTVTVTMQGKSVTSNEVIVEALNNEKEPEQIPGADETNKPQNNNGSGSKDNKTAAVRTGDEAKTIPFTVAGGVAIIVIAGIIIWRKKKML